MKAAYILNNRVHAGEVDAPVPEQLLVFSAQNKRLTVHFAGGEEPQDMEWRCAPSPLDRST